MIGLSWNVRGLGNPHSFAALKRLLKKHSPDFVFLSETKIQGFRGDSFRPLLGFSGCLCLDSVGSSGGLMLLWSDRIDVSVLSYSKGHIDARMCMTDGFRWRFTGFYGDPVGGKHRESWELLRRLRAIDSLLWLCGGDFNIMRFWLEVRN